MTFVPSAIFVVVTATAPTHNIAQGCEHLCLRVQSPYHLLSAIVCGRSIRCVFHAGLVVPCLSYRIPWCNKRCCPPNGVCRIGRSRRLTSQGESCGTKR